LDTDNITNAADKLLSVPILLKQPNPRLDPPLIFYLSRQINGDDITVGIFGADDTGSTAIF
jgi:hypothetical protein